MAIEDDENESTYELQMPFVSVISNGGPHEDQAYVCGFEMGAMDSKLASAPWVDECDFTISDQNIKQADLIAMKHGFHMITTNEMENWAEIRLVRIP